MGQIPLSSVPSYPHSPIAPHPYPSLSTPPHMNVTSPTSAIGSAGSYNIAPLDRTTYTYPHYNTSAALLHPVLTPFGPNTPVFMTQTGFSTYAPLPPTPPNGPHPSGYFAYRPAHPIYSPANLSQQQSFSPLFSPQPPPPTPGYSPSPNPLYGSYPPPTYGHVANPSHPAVTNPPYMAPTHSPVALEDTETRGTWLYMPPAGQPQATGSYEGYPTPMAHVLPLNPVGNTGPGAAAVAAEGVNSLGLGLGSYPLPPSNQHSLFASPPLEPRSPLKSLPSLLSSSRPPPLQSDPLQPDVVRRSPPGPGGSDCGTTRRSYYPNPPASRSEWVMWTGNIPSDATQDELLQFFNRIPSPGGARSAGSIGGITSGGNTSFTIKSNSKSSTPSFSLSRGRGRGGSLAHQLPHSLSTSHLDTPSRSRVLPSQGAGSSGSHSPQQSETSVYGGVQSIFLIAHSNCAFVNFETEEQLHAAIRNFNGVPLRPNGPRRTRLVCRVRNREDDLKAGVGAQRGAGMHIKWIKQQKEREAESTKTIASSSRENALSRPFLNVDTTSGGVYQGPPRPKPTSHSSGSGSTNSSVLQEFFPKRYFILKSLMESDLDLSVKKGLWATQKHNEAILDQAFRTSKEVYLIFSVNKSGEFYGYARMASPILRGVHSVRWASRTDSMDCGPAASTYLPPNEHRLYNESPLSGIPYRRTSGALSAPSELGPHHEKLSQSPSIMTSNSWDSQRLSFVNPMRLQQNNQHFELDSSAPIRAAMQKSHSSSRPLSPRPDGPFIDGDGVKGRDMLGLIDSFSYGQNDAGSVQSSFVNVRPVIDAKGKRKVTEEPYDVQANGPVWGESFKVEWIRTERLPFHRTKHLRNPWNRDAEVKVSRDGTELEMSVGQSLLEEWDKPDPTLQQGTADPFIGSHQPTERKTGSKLIGAPSTHGFGSKKGK